MWDRERVGRGLILTASSRWSQDDAKAPGRLRAATPKCKFLVPSGLESWPKKKKVPLLVLLDFGALFSA